MKVYKGFTASPGLVLGQVSRLDRPPLVFGEGPFHPEQEKQALEDAIKVAQQELDEMAGRAAPSEQAIFLFQSMMLEDEGFMNEVAFQIKAGVGAAEAMDRVGRRYAAQLAAMKDNAYMQLRSVDILDVTQRITNILCHRLRSWLALDHPVILASDLLMPTDLFSVPAGRILGLITAEGSGQSHAAIIARSLNIPGITQVGEDFLKDWSFVDLLKLRLSYGRSAVDNLAYGLGKHYWSSLREYYFGDSNTEVSGYLERKIPMRSLELETADKYNIGLDVQLFKKLSFTADMYYDKRSNILVSNNKVSGMIGIDVPQQNVGKVESKGLELSLGWNDKIRDFRYYINGNVSFMDSKVLENGEGYQPYDYLYAKGHKVGQAFGLEAVGYFRDEEDIRKSPVQTFSTVRPGDVKYKDQNNDGRIDAYDEVAIGKSTTVPEMVYGLNLGFEYKGFGVDATFQGVGGISTMLTTPHVYRPLRNNNNISTWYLKDRIRWTESTKDIANLPRLSTLDNANNYRSSTQWLENGSFFKLRNLNVYYNFPQKWSEKLRMDKLQVYVRAQDLFSLDHIDYLNCENLSLGYFDTMSISLGLNINF